MRPKSPRKGMGQPSVWRRQRQANIGVRITSDSARKVKNKQVGEAREEARIKAKRDRAKEMKDRAYNVLEMISTPQSAGGFGFSSMSQFFDSLRSSEAPSSQQTEAKLSRFAKNRAEEATQFLWSRAPEAKEKILSEEIAKRLAQEGKAIQHHLTCDNLTSISDLLKEFSMEGLIRDLEAIAPTLWQCLHAVAENPALRAEGKQRDKDLV